MERNLPKKLNNNGSALLAVFIMGAALAIVMGSMLTLGSRYFKASALAKNKSIANSENAFNLSLLSAKFLFKNNKVVWYPINYPLKGSTALPRIQVIEKALNTDEPMGTLPNSPEAYDLDFTRMGAVQIATQLSPQKLQNAYMAFGDPRQLSSNLPTFFSSPNQSWPNQPNTANQSSLNGLATSEITFIKYIFDKQYVYWARRLLVSIAKAKDSSSPRTLAEIEIDPPPEPHCKLVFAPGQSSTVKVGANVNLVLKTDSPSVSAEYSKSAAAPSIAVPSLSTAYSSIKDLGAFKNFSPAFQVSMPSPVWPGTDVGNRKIIWRIRANAIGIKQQGNNLCSIDVTVQLPPLPPPPLPPDLVTKFTPDTSDDDQLWRMDGDMQVCLVLNGTSASLVKSRLADQYAQDLNASRIRVRLKQGYVDASLPQSGGTVVTALPGNWSSIRGANPILFGWRRLWDKGGMSGINYTQPASNQWCVQVIDGCCGRGGGVGFYIDWRLY